MDKSHFVLHGLKSKESLPEQYNVFLEHKIDVLANAIGEPNTYFTSQAVYFSGAGQIFTLAMLDLCVI